VLYIAGDRVPGVVVMLTLVNRLVPGSNVNDPVALPPVKNVTPFRYQVRGDEAPSELTVPPVMVRVVPEGVVHPASAQSASCPLNVDTPPAAGSIGENVSVKPGRPCEDPEVVTARTPLLSGAKPVDAEL
jgi:hypothetical protein